MAKALKMASVGPVMVTMRSGQFPSEILMRAPLCQPLKQEKTAVRKRATRWQQHANAPTYIFPHFLHSFSFLEARQEHE